MANVPQMNEDRPRDSAAPAIARVSPANGARSRDGRRTARYEDPESSHRDIRGDIISAAIDLFFERGYEATGVQDIVDRAGCTKGGLYHYFRSKEELLLEIRNDYMGSLLRRARQIHSENHSATEALSLIIRELMLEVSKRRAQMTVAFLETRTDYDRYPEAKVQRDEWERFLVEIIAQGQRDNEFRPGLDAETVQYGIVGICVWAAFHWHPGKSTLDVEGIGRTFVDLVLRGLAVEK